MTLRTTALVAVGFVALRVVYRMIFGGGSGDGLLLVNLPRVALPGPFVGIQLFGPITSGGIANAVFGALPFATAILLVGLIGVVIDVRALLTRGSIRGPVRTVARALLVAWSTFPALRESVVRVQRARELRGERSLASLLVPVLEQTVERAIALGASMEVRGFAAVRRHDPDCERPVAISDAAIGFDGRWLLERVSFLLEPGTLTLVTGRTGSGKSSMLDAMSGLFQHLRGGEQDGKISIGGVDRTTAPPRETAAFVGVVSQWVRLSFVAPTVAEELGFALTIRGVAHAIVDVRVAEIASHLRMEHLLDREIAALSAGEACLVAIGAALVSHPVLLIVDEPLADLDTAARARVVGVLDRLAHDAGVCVVVAEHALGEWGAVVDAQLHLADGRAELLPGSVADSAVGRWAAARDRRARPASGNGGDDPVASIRGLSVTHAGRLAVDEVSFTLAAGEIVALAGPNGAGKSSLLQAMALPATRGTVVVRGRDVGTLRRVARRRAVALVPEAFDDLLFATTVAAECRRADRQADRRADHRAASSGTADAFLQFLGRQECGDTQDLLGRHPRELSAGERLCLVIAIQLSAHPSVLLVDEPTRGLDVTARALVGRALTHAAARGAAVMVATHDRDFAAEYATRTIAMAAGRLLPATSEVTA
ncbi:MAG: ATP-binding cassette domain-containing protein [Acidobacteria bacterium]|nr:ATP-binding cassette domain-containing protein [Acidobacteriota bacterium]